MKQAGFSSFMRNVLAPFIANEDPVKEWKLNACYKTIAIGFLPLLLPLLVIFFMYDYRYMLYGTFILIPVFIFSLFFLRRGKISLSVNAIIIGTTVTNILYVFQLKDDAALYLTSFMIIAAGIFLGTRAAFIWAAILSGIVTGTLVLHVGFELLPSKIAALHSRQLHDYIAPVIFVYFASAFLSILFQNYFKTLLSNIQAHLNDKMSLESKLNQAQKLEFITLLTSGMTHDFSHNLTTVKSCSNLILKKTSIDSDVATYAKTIYDTCNIIHESMSKLFALVRTKQPEKTAVDIHRVIESVLAVIKYRTPPTIAIVTTLDASQCSIKGYYSQLQSIFMNLVTNSLQAMPHGGQVTISTSNPEATLEKDQDPNTMSVSREYIEVHVRDTGIGMDEKTLSRIFEPFFSTKDAGEGTGIGMAIVKRLLEEHRANIEVKSEKGKGTVVNMRFPLCGA
jgi:signal transduction histidine kinase